MKYKYRGVTVFDYDPENKSMTAPDHENTGTGFNFCNFIPEDFKLMSDFFMQAHCHATGTRRTEDLHDTEVD
jgi:hypothetical protein